MNAFGCGAAWILGLACGVAMATDGPPEPWAPPGAETFAAEGRWKVDGKAIDAQVFVSAWSAERVVQSLRQSWPEPIAESGHGAARILGRRFGEYQVAVKVEPTPDGGSRGLWSALPLRAWLGAPPALGPSRDPEVERWFVPGAVPGRVVRSVDRHGEALVATATLRADPQLQVEQLRRAFRTQGYELRQHLQTPIGRDHPVGHLLRFEAADGRSAAATVQRMDSGASAVVVVRQRPSRHTPGAQP